MRPAPRREPSRGDALRDIVVWGERLASHVAATTREAFLEDARDQDAVCKCVEVIGEAARRLMAAEPGIEARHPALALEQAYRTRNRLAHGYDTLDYALVWAAATESIPPMVEAARALLAADDAGRP